MEKVRTGIQINANVHIRIYDGSGNLRDGGDYHNTVTAYGFARITDLLSAVPGSSTKIGYMHLGTGTGGTTNLSSRITQADKAVTPTDSGAILTCQAVYPQSVGGEPWIITEAGLFETAGVGADMWAYIDSTKGFSHTKNDYDVMTVTWTVTFTNLS